MYSVFYSKSDTVKSSRPDALMRALDLDISGGESEGNQYFNPDEHGFAHPRKLRGKGITKAPIYAEKRKQKQLAQKRARRKNRR